MFPKKRFANRINILALLSFLAITCITFFKSALELEDAEQAYYSQWLRWGYDDQPPLYTWLQYAINQVFGVQKVSFSLLRGAIFAFILLAMYHAAQKILPNKKKSELSVLLLVLLPVFIDFTFRRLSHTSLLCLSVMLSVIMVHRLLENKTWINYTLLGCVLSMGMLSKYNFVFFLGALLGTACWDASLRKIVLDKKFLLTLGVMGLLLFPHSYWLVGSEGYVTELRKSIALKTENGTANSLYLITPLLSLILTLLKFLAPLLAVFLLAFAGGKVTFQRLKWDWFTKLGVVQLGVLVLFFSVMNVQKVEERWLLPLLLPFIILLLRSVQLKSVQKWTLYLFAVFISVIVLQTLRTPVEKVFNIPSSVHFGFDPLSNSLNTNFADQRWILPNVTYGGNIRLLNPQKGIFTKDDFSLPTDTFMETDKVEVVVGKEYLKGSVPLDTILEFGKEKDTLYVLRR